MSDEHTDRDQLLGFLDGHLPAAERHEVQRHLLTCADCETRLVELLSVWNGETSLEPASADTEYRGLLQRVMAESGAKMERRASRLCRERTEAGMLLTELLGATAEHRVALVRGDARFHSWGLFERLLEQARRDIFESPRDAEACLELAVEVAGQLDRRRYGPGSVEAALARAWAYLGNARRALADFAAAEQAFAIAEAHLERSWLDPLDEALLCELKAILRRAQRRFDEALPLFEQAVVLYREVNEPHLQGQALIAKGLTLQYAGETDAAAAALREGLFLVDPAEEPRLVMIAHGNIILCLCDGGRYGEARALLADVRPLWQRFGTPPDLSRLRWIEGRVANGLDRLDEAEVAFSEVRAAFVASGNAYDVALVSLDLAAVYARQGRAAETKRLAEEMLPIFRSREIHREAIAALLCFQRAAEMEQVTQSMIGEIASYLERARANPGLRFRAGQG